MTLPKLDTAMDVLDWARWADEDFDSMGRLVKGLDVETAEYIAECIRLRKLFENVDSWAGAWPMSYDEYGRRMEYLRNSIKSPDSDVDLKLERDTNK